MKTSIDKKLSTEKLTREVVNYIIQKIVKKIHPEKIIIFGSLAKGKADMHSDLDLFVVKNSGESSRKIRRKIDNLLWGRRFAVDIIVKNESEIDWNIRAKNSFYLHDIFKEGKIVYEKK